MWWPFGGQAKQETTEQIEEIRRELRDHEARVKSLETEWHSVYQKLARVLGHITKRDALAARVAMAPDDTESAPPPPPPQAPPRLNVDELDREAIAQLPVLGTQRGVQ